MSYGFFQCIALIRVSNEELIAPPILMFHAITRDSYVGRQNKKTVNQTSAPAFPQERLQVFNKWFVHKGWDERQLLAFSCKSFSDIFITPIQGYLLLILHQDHQLLNDLSPRGCTA